MKKQMEAWVFFAEKLMKKYVAAYGKPDLIHAQSSVWAGIAAKRLSEKSGIAYCVTEHASVFMKQQVLGPSWEQCWSTPYIRDAFDQAQAVVAVSRALKEKLSVYTEAPIQVIPNGVDTRFFKPCQKKARDTFHFLTLSHLVPRKNIALLLHALKQLADPKTHLTIGGDGPEKERLKKLVIALGIEPQVTFLGPLSREGVRAAFQEADAFVLASQHETFGVVCIEAMASGIPVVASRCGGTEDIVNDAIGRLVAVNDLQALCEGMARVRELAHTCDPQQLHQMAAEQYGSEAVCRQYERVYGGCKSSSTTPLQPLLEAE